MNGADRMIVTAHLKALYRGFNNNEVSVDYLRGCKGVLSALGVTIEEHDDDRGKPVCLLVRFAGADGKVKMRWVELDD